MAPLKRNELKDLPQKDLVSECSRLMEHKCKGPEAGTCLCIQGTETENPGCWCGQEAGYLGGCRQRLSSRQAEAIQRSSDFILRTVPRKVPEHLVPFQPGIEGMVGSVQGGCLGGSPVTSFWRPQDTNCLKFDFPHLPPVVRRS